MYSLLIYKGRFGSIISVIETVVGQNGVYYNKVFSLSFLI